MIRYVLPLLVTAGLPAAELVIRDVRLGMGTRPLDFTYDYSGNSANGSGDDSFDADLGIEGGGRWSFARSGDAFGLVVGGDLILDAWSYDGTDGMASTWLRLSAGPGWAITDRWTGIAEIGVQFGVTTLSLPATSQSPSFEADGTAIGYDLRIGANWMLTRRIGLGGHVGWLESTHDLSGDADLTIEQSDWFIGLELLWRFNDAPTRLE